MIITKLSWARHNEWVGHAIGVGRVLDVTHVKLLGEVRFDKWAYWIC